MLTLLLRFTRSLGDACMKDVDSASFYNDRVPDGLAKMLPLPKKPYVSNKTEVVSRYWWLFGLLCRICKLGPMFVLLWGEELRQQAQSGVVGANEACGSW